MLTDVNNKLIEMISGSKKGDKQSERDDNVSSAEIQSQHLSNMTH